jgi:hypothetical protein
MSCVKVAVGDATQTTDVLLSGIDNKAQPRTMSQWLRKEVVITHTDCNSTYMNLSVALMAFGMTRHPPTLWSEIIYHEMAAAEDIKM